MPVLAIPTWCLWEGLSRAGNDHANLVYVLSTIDLSSDGHVNSVFSSGLVGVPV